MIDLSLPKHDKNYFEALDGWRGVSACMVALFHFRAVSHITDSLFVKSGGSFLDFFFVLSGFVIFANYFERLKNGYSLRDFMILRFGRLYPLHFFVLMLFIGGDLVQLVFPFFAKGATYAPFHGPGESARYVIANLLLIHSFGVTDFISLNAPSWSISAEFYTYLVYALLIVASRGRKSALVLTTGLLLVNMIIHPRHMTGTADLGIIRCVFGFGTGGLVWFLYGRVRDRVKILPDRFFQIAEFITVIGVFTYVQILVTYIERFAHLPLLTPFIFAWTVFVFAFQRGFASKILRARPFALLGALSYSIYMLHMFISAKLLYGFGHVFQKISGTRIFTSVDGVDTIGTNLWIGDMICLGYLLGVVAGSYITYRLIELPCRDWFRRKAGKRSLADVAAKV